ncbi:hypothetical protein [Fluviicola chungangensis]|uniref:Uncharacterized protein n=1 Tax=Fluviicola chungangensis TaxID=2597671 RepID=A0A556MZY3_9FLAO|nr:hypothetical protein [Fluviicola chungangensis]TSJ45446.1 hypothetical protein FO442_06740 [Fluviicola chungangensis]
MKPTVQQVFLTTISSIFIATSSFSQTNTLPTSGNVGIGTTSPSAKLQVNGTAKIDSMLIVKDSLIVNKTARIQSDLKVVGNTIIKNDLKVSGTTTLIGNTIIKEGDFKIKALGDSTLPDDGVLMIDANGKVKNGGDLKSLVYTQVPAVMPCASDMNGGYIQTAPFWQASSNPQRMFLINTSCSPDPRLGVGVKPDAKMHVRLIKDSELHPLVIDKLVSNNPNVEPYKLLQLNSNGTLLSRKVRVDMENWADFVFSTDYPLMDLDSLEQFILKNHHLPNIQSTDSVLVEGIDLGEMNRLLLQKVEELTLYVLQEKKRNQELEDRLRKIEEKLNK